jgi:hypothetical protein
VEGTHIQIKNYSSKKLSKTFYFQILVAVFLDGKASIFREKFGTYFNGIIDNLRFSIDFFVNGDARLGSGQLIYNIFMGKC